MYVCICNAITDDEVRSAKGAGAVTERDVYRHFGVEMQCGRCVPMMRAILAEQSADGAGRAAEKPARRRIPEFA